MSNSSMSNLSFPSHFSIITAMVPLSSSSARLTSAESWFQDHFPAIAKNAKDLFSLECKSLSRYGIVTIKDLISLCKKSIKGTLFLEREMQEFEKIQETFNSFQNPDPDRDTYAQVIRPAKQIIKEILENNCLKFFDNRIDLGSIPSSHLGLQTKLQEIQTTFENLSRSDLRNIKKVQQELSSLDTAIQELKAMEGGKITAAIKAYATQYNMGRIWRSVHHLGVQNLSVLIERLGIAEDSLYRLNDCCANDFIGSSSSTIESEVSIDTLPDELLSLIAYFSDHPKALSQVSRHFRAIVADPHFLDRFLKDFSQSLNIPKEILVSTLTEMLENHPLVGSYSLLRKAQIGQTNQLCIPLSRYVGIGSLQTMIQEDLKGSVKIETLIQKIEKKDPLAVFMMLERLKLVDTKQAEKILTILLNMNYTNLEIVRVVASSLLALSDESSENQVISPECLRLLVNAFLKLKDFDQALKVKDTIPDTETSKKTWAFETFLKELIKNGRCDTALKMVNNIKNEEKNEWLFNFISVELAKNDQFDQALEVANKITLSKLIKVTTLVGIRDNLRKLSPEALRSISPETLRNISEEFAKNRMSDDAAELANKIPDENKKMCTVS